MSIAVKLDEPLSPLIAAPLVAAGYVVHTVVEQGWAGTKDVALWPLVQAERIFFITADKGFGDIRTYPPGTHAGILLLRPDRESVRGYATLVETVVKRYRLDELVGCVTVATPAGIRRRTPHD